jgi:hypothetical protein
VYCYLTGQPIAEHSARLWPWKWEVQHRHPYSRGTVPPSPISPVLWIRNLLLWIRITYEFWIRVLLDFQKVPEESHRYKKIVPVTLAQKIMSVKKNHKNTKTPIWGGFRQFFGVVLLCGFFLLPTLDNLRYRVDNLSCSNAIQLGGEKETDQWESSLVISHTISIPFFMAFWD